MLTACVNATERVEHVRIKKLFSAINRHTLKELFSAINRHPLKELFSAINRHPLRFNLLFFYNFVVIHAHESFGYSFNIFKMLGFKTCLLQIS